MFFSERSFLKFFGYKNNTHSVLEKRVNNTQYMYVYRFSTRRLHLKRGTFGRRAPGRLEKPVIHMCAALRVYPIYSVYVCMSGQICVAMSGLEIIRTTHDKRIGCKILFSSSCSFHIRSVDRTKKRPTSGKLSPFEAKIPDIGIVLRRWSPRCSCPESHRSTRHGTQ